MNFIEFHRNSLLNFTAHQSYFSPELGYSLGVVIRSNILYMSVHLLMSYPLVESNFRITLYI